MAEFSLGKNLTPAVLLSATAIGGFLLGDLVKNRSSSSSRVGVYAAEIICPKAEPFVKIVEDTKSLGSGDFKFTCEGNNGRAAQPLDEVQQGLSYSGMIGNAHPARPVDIYVTYNSSGGQADNIESFISERSVFDGGQLQLSDVTFPSGVPIEGISFTKP